MAKWWIMHLGVVVIQSGVFCAGCCSGKNTHPRTHALSAINDNTNFGRYCGETRGKTATHARRSWRHGIRRNAYDIGTKNIKCWQLDRTQRENFASCHTKRLRSAVRIATGPQALTKPVLPTVRSTASSLNFQYSFSSLKSSSSCLLLLPLLRVTIYPSFYLSFKNLF